MKDFNRTVLLHIGKKIQADVCDKPREFEFEEKIFNTVEICILWQRNFMAQFAGR